MHLLVIWADNSWLGRSKALEAVDLLAKSNAVSASLCRLSASPCSPERDDDLEGVVAGFDGFLVPLLPDGLVEDISEARSSSSGAALVRCALATGKAVWTLASAFGPEAPGPLPQARAVEKRRKLAEACGMKIVADALEGINAIPAGGAPSSSAWHGVLTEGDVLTAAGKGAASIRLASDVVVTPLARDAAAEARIELIAGREESR